MFSLQQLIKATATAATTQSGGCSVNGNAAMANATLADLYQLLLRQVAVAKGSTTTTSSTAAAVTTTTIPKQFSQHEPQQNPNEHESSQAMASLSLSKINFNSSVISTVYVDVDGRGELKSADEVATKSRFSATPFVNRNFLQQRSQDIQRYFHTQQTQGAKSSPHQQQHHQNTKFAMSSLAAEPLQAPKQIDEISTSSTSNSTSSTNELGASCIDVAGMESGAPTATGKKPCFKTGLAEILQFMELIGNLKHTKRTGWVLRDVNDCESISGHMYRMSMLTFLLDGSEGLNQIRCMELALVHDLAESLVGDITPFCGVSKDEKRAMEFKAMEDICKLIEPRGKRIMELFEEYEHAQSPESKFVKDLDRLDMVMQAFEYEKRDNCLLKHQEFFDSTEGKFNHPFVKKLVNEIYEQRAVLAKTQGATPPPAVQMPTKDSETATTAKVVNGHSGSS